MIRAVTPTYRSDILRAAPVFENATFPRRASIFRTVENILPTLDAGALFMTGRCICGSAIIPLHLVARRVSREFPAQRMDARPRFTRHVRLGKNPDAAKTTSRLP